MNTIRAQGTRFVDDAGRERIFCGVNVVDKSDYDARGTQTFPLTENDLRGFSARGINLIRLGFTWAKLEPAPGQYNEPYLDSVSGVLDLCAQYGIYVFLDMHQDLFSPVTNGDGAPRWATLTDGHPVHPTRFVWAEDYFWGKACHSAFDHFWANTSVGGVGLQDRFAALWAHVTTRLGGKGAVIGFDLFNEPFPGTPGGACFRSIVSGAVKAVLFGRNVHRKRLVRDLFSADRKEKGFQHITYPVLREATRGADAAIARFDRAYYTPFLRRVGKAVRDTGTDKLLFVENNYYSNLGIPCRAEPIAFGGKRDAQQVFAPHAYDFMVDTPDYRYASNDRVGGIFAEHARTQKRLHMPVVVGEWGGFGSPDDDKWLDHISFLLSLFDRNKWSHAYWQYGDSFFDSPLMRVFVRPYPQAVCGTIERYAYDADKRVFRMTFSQDTDGESVVCTPFPVRELTVDGETSEYSCSGAATTVRTHAGRHTLEIRF